LTFFSYSALVTVHSGLNFFTNYPNQSFVTYIRLKSVCVVGMSDRA